MFTNKKPREIKRQTVTVPIKPPQTSLFAQKRPSFQSASRLNPDRARSSQADSRSSRASPATSAKRKLLQSSQRQSATTDFGRDDSDEDGDNANDDIVGIPSKKQRVNWSQKGLPKRHIRSALAFSEAIADEDRKSTLVHAADLPTLDKSSKYEPAFEGLSEGFEVALQYPSAAPRERFHLIKPANDSQGFDASQDISEVMLKVIEHYLPDTLKTQFNNESTGFPQRLSRAVNKKSESGIKEVIDEWNVEITKLRDDGTIVRTLDSSDCVNASLAERIINQTYARTVSLSLKWLHQYEAGTDNVYGELLPKFVSQILRDTQMGPDQIFVDLGSGVGNVVLQAALEAGCESWGCEMMEKYCEVADTQQSEFDSRSLLWGLSTGKINLEKGDFLTNPRILEVLQKADAVLVNNQVFSPKLNDALTSLFLDLKEGCRIVSLKSFVPAGHKISTRNQDSVYNVLRVEQKEYFSRCVSWTDQGGKYYISTKDSTAVTKFHAVNA